jgi:hypothetical protein
MDLRLVDGGWDKELAKALRTDRSKVRIVSPFIKKRAAERLLKYGSPKVFQVITRFNLRDFMEKVSDLAALRLISEAGAQIRGIRNLHAKLYLFGVSRAIVTSANLTEAALTHNHELGFVANGSRIVGECCKYFDDLWGRAGSNLESKRLESWERKIAECVATGARPEVVAGLGDEGVDAGFAIDLIEFCPMFADGEQAFVKFFGESRNRADRSLAVLEEVRRSGCHWACTYPKGKRPRRVDDGAVIFMGRLVREPNDVLIYGRALGKRHVDGRDDASPADLKRRPWKADWPHYVRVDHPEFISGNLSNGVSLNELMDSMGSNAFASTQRNLANGVGNTDPRRAYMQQASVELSGDGLRWLNNRFEVKCENLGKLEPSALTQLDWPSVSFYSK